MRKKEEAIGCRFCNSDNVIIRKDPGYAILFFLLLLGLPLSFFKKTYYCFGCENELKVKK